MKRTKKEQKLIDLATKKSVHISMSAGTHSQFRIACFKHKVSMQEVIEEFASLVANDNSDTDSIYSILELENPLRDRERR